MKLLLDTHIILWALVEQSRLSDSARMLMDDTANELIFSAASLWEIAIKRSVGKLHPKADPQILRYAMLRANYVELPVSGDHAVAVAGLPPSHKDPFDRILIAQATVEGVTLLTADSKVTRYPGPIRLV